MRTDQGAKYVNTAETEFFKKKQMLYGLDLAKAAMAKANRVIVVEGYTDVLALHQAGIEEIVGVMGTAITEEQVKSLAVVEEVVLALDADAAGQEAMLRAQRVAGERKMRLRVAAMPAGEDPAEMMAVDGGIERFRALLESAADLSEFQIGLVLERTDVNSPADRDRALSEIAPILAAMGNTPAREEQIRRVTERLDLGIEMVMSRMTMATPTVGGSSAADHDQRVVPRRTAELTSRERRERALLAMCIALPAEGREYLARLGEQHLSPLAARAAAWLSEHLDDPASNLPQADAELSGLIAELVIVAHDEPASPEAMELNYLLLEQRRLETEIAAAGERDDYELRAALSRDRAALVERIARAERVGG